MKTSGELRNSFYKWLDDNPDGKVWDWMHKILEEEKSNRVEPPVMQKIAETKDFDWLEDKLEIILSGDTTKEEKKNKLYEVIFDDLVREIQSLRESNFTA